MGANPFKPTAGAQPPHLIGRESALELFLEGLEDGAGVPGLLSIISGPRGIGKTALLHRAERLALENGWAYVSDTATTDRKPNDVGTNPVLAFRR